MANQEFERPKEARTFYPTEEEFEDPLAYIRKIKPEAEKFGICKIKPPNRWNAPFSFDPNKFKFRPRIQKLNQLDAVTRIKLTFTDRIINYWQLLGTELIIPVLSTKPLDLYNLYQFVNSDEFVKSKDDDDTKWRNVAKRMGFESCQKAELKKFYEEYLAPFHQWKVKYLDKESTPIPDECSNSKAMKRVTKRQMGGRGVVLSQGKKQKDGDKVRVRPSVKDKNCQLCGKRSYKDSVLECKGCQGRYHPHCFENKKNVRKSANPIPKVWHCPDCLWDKLRPDSSLESGFDESEEEYTLQQFGEMADTFKADHFNLPACRVPLETVEKEFWRLVSSINEGVEVKYGADLDARDYLKQDSGSADEDKRGPWNFCKLPKLSGSAFGHFNSNISGMTSPWLYVGMCFSTFCWHNEDHWSYSISYLHRGDVKTWYGVPGAKAEEFESAMKSIAPELFAQTPNLLHQLVTIMNPSVLQKKNVPVYRLDQKPGEFIITFPRAYHAGFNQGFNFAEAVNFAPADWVAVGRKCVENYSQFKRQCVFSHDELICSMAREPEKMDWLITSAANLDMRKLIKAEREFRTRIQGSGVKRQLKILFENEFDDHRQCHVCKTTLFISAISCECYQSKPAPLRRMVCPRHFEQFGCEKCRKNPAGYVLMYRYSVGDLVALGKPLKEKAEKFNTWKSQALTVLRSYRGQPTIHQFEILLMQAKAHNFPRIALLENAEAAYADLMNEPVKPSSPKRPRLSCDSGNESSPDLKAGTRSFKLESQEDDVDVISSSTPIKPSTQQGPMCDDDNDNEPKFSPSKKCASDSDATSSYSSSSSTNSSPNSSASGSGLELEPQPKAESSVSSLSTSEWALKTELALMSSYQRYFSPINTTTTEPEKSPESSPTSTGTGNLSPPKKSGMFEWRGYFA